MNERIQKLAEQAEEYAHEQNDKYGVSYKREYDKKFAELIIRECTQLLFDESERLYAYSSECDNLGYSEEAETCAEKCMDNIIMIETHFGVE